MGSQWPSKRLGKEIYIKREEKKAELEIQTPAIRSMV